MERERDTQIERRRGMRICADSSDVLELLLFLCVFRCPVCFLEFGFLNRADFVSEISLHWLCGHTKEPR